MLDETALADAATGEEEAEDIAMTAIEVINLRGHIATVPGIPAIVAYDNHVIAFSDNRSGVTDATSWGDVGSVGNISIEVRHSKIQLRLSK